MPRVTHSGLLCSTRAVAPAALPTFAAPELHNCGQYRELQFIKAYQGSLFCPEGLEKATKPQVGRSCSKVNTMT